MTPSERERIQALRDEWRASADSNEFLRSTSRGETITIEPATYRFFANQLDALLSRLASSLTQENRMTTTSTDSPASVSQPTFHPIAVLDEAKFERGSENDAVMLVQKSNSLDHPEQVVVVHRSAIQSLIDRLAASSLAQPEPDKFTSVMVERYAEVANDLAKWLDAQPVAFGPDGDPSVAPVYTAWALLTALITKPSASSPSVAPHVPGGAK